MEAGAPIVGCQLTVGICSLTVTGRQGTRYPRHRSGDWLREVPGLLEQHSHCRAAGRNHAGSTGATYRDLRSWLGRCQSSK